MRDERPRVKPRTLKRGDAVLYMGGPAEYVQRVVTPLGVLFRLIKDGSPVEVNPLEVQKPVPPPVLKVIK